jgi:YihY family inner membrane protein
MSTWRRGGGRSPLAAVDRWQQRHTGPAIVCAVVKKFGDDGGSMLAALVTFYGFLAVFPLLLALVTVLGLILGRSSSAENWVLHSALRDFPVVGDSLRANVHALRGGAVGVVVGVVGLLWGSLRVAQVLQHAMAEVWQVRHVARPGLGRRLARGVMLLGILGIGTIATTVVSGAGPSGAGGADAALLTVVGIAVTLLLNVALFLLVFRVSTPTPQPVAWRTLMPGAESAAVGWTVLQALGGYLVGHHLRHASAVYGMFGIVLGLIFWLTLATQLTLYSAELNVVLARRLWPRALVGPPHTAADRAVLVAAAEEEERTPDEDVEVYLGGMRTAPSKRIVSPLR